MKVFEDSKSFSDVTEKDLKFTDLVFELKSLGKQYFVSYKNEFGIETNELDEFIMYYMESELVEDENSDDTAIIYIPNKKSVNSVLKFLENWDLIYISNYRACISKSNSKEIAKLMNSMINLCK